MWTYSSYRSIEAICKIECPPPLITSMHWVRACVAAVVSLMVLTLQLHVDLIASVMTCEKSDSVHESSTCWCRSPYTTHQKRNLGLWHGSWKVLLKCEGSKRVHKWEKKSPFTAEECMHTHHSIFSFSFVGPRSRKNCRFFNKYASHLVKITKSRTRIHRYQGENKKTDWAQSSECLKSLPKFFDHNSFALRRHAALKISVCKFLRLFHFWSLFWTYVPQMYEYVATRTSRADEGADRGVWSAWRGLLGPFANNTQTFT